MRDAAINVLIGSDDEQKNEEMEGGGGATIEMQNMPPLMPPIPRWDNVSKEDEVELEMAADNQALPPEPAYSEKQMLPDLEDEDVAAAFSANNSMDHRQSPSQQPSQIDKVESDEDEFDSDSEFEFRV